MVDDRRHTVGALVQPRRQPLERVGPVDDRRDPARDVERAAEDLEAVELVGPDVSEQEQPPGLGGDVDR